MKEQFQHLPITHPNALKRRGGFTLAELLTVVAIILVLMAIAIPVFTGATKNAEEAACEANRRNVTGAYTTSFLLNQDQDTRALFDTVLKSLQDQNKRELYPSEGDYTGSFSKSGRVAVKCSVHGLSPEDEVKNWVNGQSYSGIGDTTKRKDYAKAMGNTEEWFKV